jgi:geranylgeranyl diphosphate synthase type II
VPTAAVETPKKDKRASTAHLKVVPETRELRDRVRAAAAEVGRALDRSRPLTKQDLQEKAEDLLRRLELSESYLGFAMVALSNDFWREQVSSIA